MSDIDIGDDVKVVSGDHEGRAGRVVYKRNVQMDYREEPYALVEFMAVNSANERYVDQISVPVRRLEKK